MSFRQLSLQSAAALLLVIISLAFLPLFGDVQGAGMPWAECWQIWLIYGMLIAAVIADASGLSQTVTAAALLILPHAAAWLLLGQLDGRDGQANASFFLLVAAAWLLAWRCVTILSSFDPVGWWERTALNLVVPAIFGVWLIILWEALVRGFGVPFILLPPPSAIGARIATSLPILFADVQQTIFKSVFAGFAIGCSAGFITAILADRFGFLRRGLLPIGNLVSALPIIGVAPIMVMWFGFGWESKAAVVVIMTFFPMLVNTVAGLTQSGQIRTYASDYWQTLRRLRLPAAMPFIFNGLKINSTLAMIGAIIAEFFGTPVVGMGFRISTENGRLNLDMVWAEIAVAALAGSVFYGVIALIERAVTFWHPSIRGGRA
jgi:NitT/TauT family transport system permease protein